MLYQENLMLEGCLIEMKINHLILIEIGLVLCCFDKRRINWPKERLL